MSSSRAPAIAELAATLAAEAGLAVTFGRPEPPEILAVGWATVELERAERELDRRLGQVAWRAAPPDLHLGATARVGAGIVLLEPSTEGRLAAALARRGEGPVALYVVGPASSAPDAAAMDPDAAPPDPLTAAAGPETGPAAEGPLGPQRLVLGGPAWGPHVLVVGLPSPG